MLGYQKQSGSWQDLSKVWLVGLFVCLMLYCKLRWIFASLGINKRFFHFVHIKVIYVPRSFCLIPFISFITRLPYDNPPSIEHKWPYVDSVCYLGHGLVATKCVAHGKILIFRPPRSTSDKVRWIGNGGWDGNKMKSILFIYLKLLL